MSGLTKLGDWSNTILTMARFHLSPPAPYAVATILVQLLGSVALIVGPYRWLGAIALSGFTARAMVAYAWVGHIQMPDP